MITTSSIIKEGNSLLKQKSVNITIPVSKEDQVLMMDLLQYTIQSQDMEMAKKYNLRPGVGLAAPQIGVLKRIFAIFLTDENNIPFILAIANPQILNRSKALIYLNTGEGCLSVERVTEGITLRHKEITISGYIYNFKYSRFEQKKMTLKDYHAIVFQHEYDHLDGILYTDKLITLEEAQKKGTPLWEETSED